MHIVKIYNGGEETTIHSEKQKLYDGQVVKGVNEIDSFTFTMLPFNTGFDKVNEFTTLVKVYNAHKDKYEFIGRALYPEDQMTDAGLILKKVVCESVFGYFCDSQQRYVAPQNWTVRGLLQHLIDCHNSQVEEEKQFKIGTVTVEDDNDNLYLGISRENTWDALKSNLLDKIGGEFQYREEADGLYIDYVKELGETKETEIALSVNMKAITREKDPTAFVTRLIPLGAKLSDETEERVDISSVNGGRDYIDDTEAIAEYGIHVGYIEFDDVTSPNILRTKGMKWLEENNKVQVKYSITALDLSRLGLSMDDFEIFNYHPIKNNLLGIDDTARIIKQTIDVCDETKSTIEVGDNFKTLSDIEIEQRKVAAANIATLKETTSGLNGKVNKTQSDLTDLAQKVDNLDIDIELEQEEVFNALTDNGALQGLYMHDGDLYINASYIKSGTILADLIKSGKLQSVNGKAYFNLDTGAIGMTDTNGNSVALFETGINMTSASGNKINFAWRDGTLPALMFHNASGKELLIFTQSPIDENAIQILLPKADGSGVTAKTVYWKTIAGIPMITSQNAELELDASEINGVNLTGGQIITGAKSFVGANTFDGEQKFSNKSYCPTITDSAGGVGCAFKASRGLFNEALLDKLIMTASTGKIPFYKYTGTSGGSMTGLTEVASIGANGELNLGTANSKINGDANGWIHLKSNDAAIVCRASTDKLFYPATDNAWYLGGSSYRWKSVYAVSGSINTSDRNQKENIKDIDEKYIQLFDKLQPVSYEFIGEEHDRVHIGFISQDVKEAMDETGLSDLDFAAYCRDIKKETVFDENGDVAGEREVLDENGNPVYTYSLRYGEFIALNTKMIQMNRKKLAEQQAEIDELKKAVAELTAALKKG